MGDTGLEHPPKTSEKTAVSKTSGAESGAVGAGNDRFDPDLAMVIERWDTLPEAIRAGIVAMVKAAGGTEHH